MISTGISKLLANPRLGLECPDYDFRYDAEEFIVKLAALLEIPNLLGSTPFGVSRIVVECKGCGDYSSLKRKKKFSSSDGGNSIQILPSTTDREPGGTEKGV